MATIWTEDANGWQLLEPSGFPSEARLHEIIARAPQVLPLAGSPRLVVLGTEVPLGGGFADIVAIESTGRPVVIEVKLEKNPEARRAVIAQVLSYASSLYRMSVDELTRVLTPAMSRRQLASLPEAVQPFDQDGAFDMVAFSSALAESLATGDIRLVLVLDSAPTELISVVGFLGAIAPNLTLDLVTVTAFRVGENSVIVPQRIEPGRFEAPAPQGRGTAATDAPTVYSAGAGEFENAIGEAPKESHDDLRRLTAWAQALADDGLATLRTGRGRSRWTLVPIVKGGDAGLLTIWNDWGAYITPWRTVVARWAPETLDRLDASDTGVAIGQGNSVRQVPGPTPRPAQRSL